MAFRDVSKTEELVELYEEEDLLWNTSHDEYHRQSKRKQALNRIGGMLGIPASEVTKKISSLRSYYRKELNKIKQSKVKISKGGELYVSKWDHFKNIDRFLYPYIQQDRKMGKISDGDDSSDPDDPEDDGEIHESLSLKQEDTENTVDEDGSTNSSVRKRKHQEEEMIESQPRKRVSERERSGRMCQGQSDDLNQPERQRENDVKICQSSSQSKTLPNTMNTPAEDREDVFAKHVANELRLISDLQTRQFVKLKIQNILFAAQFGCQIDISIKTSSNSLDLTFPVPTFMDENKGQTGTYNSHNNESAGVFLQNVE